MVNLDTYVGIAEKAQQIGETTDDPLGAVASEFGIPPCLADLGKQALALLAGPALIALQEQFIKSRAAVENKIRNLYYAILTKLGLKENDDGSISIFGQLDFLQSALGLIGALAGAVAGALNVIAEIQADIENIINCLNQFKQLQDAKSGNFSQTSLAGTQTINQQFLGAFTERQSIYISYIEKYDRVIRDIDEILEERRLNPDLEPCFSDSAEFDYLFSSIPNKSLIKRCPIEDPGIVPTDEVFRLTYGPPISRRGQYILTSDGLYYDSQTGGLDPVFLAISGIVQPGDAWKYNYDPNLGGKGDAVSVDVFDKFKDNVFDKDIIDDSVGLTSYYDKDHFLAVLRQQRNKHLYDLSSQLQEFFANGETEDSAIVKNQRQVIISEIINHNDKINRRKKQIEVAVKVPALYGNGEILFLPGEIPINDFSFLENYNLSVDLQKQKTLIFSQAEVNGIVLPIQPKFVKASTKSPSIGYNHLVVPSVGKGGIIYNVSGSQGATILNLDDQITTDGLFAIYNFLDSNLVLPSSLDFKTTNCATNNLYNNAQLIGTNPDNVFFSGLSIPYFEGLVKNKSSFPQGASALGSVLRLPDTPEFNNLAYSRSGFTMECWVHVPNILDAETGWLSGTTSSLTKVLLANENVGVASGVTSTDHLGDIRDLDFLDNDKSSSYVRGLVCGFTRDRRITQESVGYSNDNADNDPVSSLSFFLAPTRSRDASSLSWINNDECQDFESFYKMKVDLSANELIGNVSSQFVLIDISVDPDANAITFYADGQVIATSSITNVFGVDIGQSLNVPTFKKPNSFEYTASTTDGPTTIKTGPKLDPFYTPWIVGGGWTDGMYLNGNFMGGDRGGIVSGLRGHVGSLKFYSKPLNTAEVLNNFNIQKGYFKNINI